VRTSLADFFSILLKKDFEEIVPEKIRKLFGGPYGWCAMNVLSMRRYGRKNVSGAPCLHSNGVLKLELQDTDR
jgi:hypothetical protein